MVVDHNPLPVDTSTIREIRLSIIDWEIPAASLNYQAWALTLCIQVVKHDVCREAGCENNAKYVVCAVYVLHNIGKQIKL